MIGIVVLAISALIQIITVGAVSFNSSGSVDGNSKFNCNSNVTLVCKSEERPVNIVLLINGIQTIVCGQSCFVNRPVLGRYTTEHNASVGLINVYLPSVNETDQAKLFTCQDIQSTNDIRPKIIVYPERDKVSMVIHVLDNDVQITVATGCVLLDEKITFVWRIIKDEPNSLPLSVSNKEFVQNDTEDNGHCKSSENCGATGKSSVLTFKKASDGTGERYYVQCTVVVNDESVPGRIPLISNRTFFLTGQTTATTTDPGEDNSQLDLGLGLGISLGLLAIIAAFCTILCLIKDPVHDLSVSPPISIGSKMTVKLQFKSRLCSMKTFHVMLSDGKSFTLSKNCAIELTDLNPDSTYIASVFSTVCIFQSCRKSIEFNTIDRPLPPYNVCEEKTLRTGSSVTLNWNRAKGPKHNFVIKYQRTKGLKRDWMFTGVINDTRYTLDGLKPGTSYTLLINAVNDAGVSEDSETLFVKTRGCPFPPYNICEEKTLRTENSVTLNWNRAKGPKHNFVIKYQRTKGLKRDWMFTGLLNDTRHTLDGLKPGTSYTLLIHAVNDVGCSEDSAPLFVKTRALKPILPEEFRCESVKDNEVVLSWKPFKNIRKQQFILTVYNMSEELPPGQERKDTEICIPYTGKTVMTYTVMELKPSSKYMFEIYTSTGKRLSERSAIASVETADRGEDADGVHGKRKSSKTTSVFLITRT